MKVCKKCNDFTYRDDAENCPVCETKLVKVSAAKMMAIDKDKLGDNNMHGGQK